MIFSLFKKDPAEKIAISLYSIAVENARRPVFYAQLGVPDTPEGRFDLISLHVYLILRRLKAEGEHTQKLSQSLFDVFFRNMDDSLREMGVGDLTVGKKIRAMAEAFYGRVGAYETALDNSELEELAQAISRNVFEETNAMGAMPIARYTKATDDAFAALAIDGFLAGEAPFPDIEV